VNGNLVITVGVAALAVFFAGIIALAVEARAGSRLHSLLGCRWLCAMGKYSYAIYVFHALILIATVQFVPRLSQAPEYIAKPIVMVWITAASFAAAWFSYHLFEMHFLRLKRLFEYRQANDLQTLPSAPPQPISHV
jgi:peptidoglycan/LPS O-acetylase OafA/YrhL